MMVPVKETELELLKKCLTASLYEESSWQVIEESGSKPTPTVNPMRLAGRWVRKSVIRVISRRGYSLVRRDRFDPERRARGDDWPCFGFTMIGKSGLDLIEKCGNDVLERGIPGDFCETGAWRGGATIFMRALLRARGVADRVVWVADSFEGLPPAADAADGWDMSHVDHLKVSIERVQSHFERFGLLDGQVKFLKGWFCDTLPTAPIEKLALLRLDGDMYSSTMGALRALYHKVSPGGYVIVDDYFSWPSCRKAVDDFIRERDPSIKLLSEDDQRAHWQVPEHTQ